MKKQHRQKLTVRVTPQTAYNLERLMTMSGQKTPGRVVDKLVREKNACPARAYRRKGERLMKYDCGKPEWAEMEPCPLETGELEECAECTWAREREEVQ